MVTLSKEMLDLPCHKVIHLWTENCERAFRKFIIESFKGSSKFFLVIYLLRLIANFPKYNIELIKTEFLRYLKSIGYGMTLASGFLYTSCTIRKILGKYYICTTLAVPSAISGSLAFALEDSKMRILHSIIFTNMAIEVLIRWGTGRNVIRRSRLLDTFYFMNISSVLMHLIKNFKYKKMTNLWFFSSLTKEKLNQKIEEKSLHIKNVIKEASKFFLAAYAFQTVKNILGNLRKGPLFVLKSIFDLRSVKFGSFFGLYVIIYKVSLYYLNLYYNKFEKFHTLVAGFLAGFSYFINPNLALMTLAITTLLQINWINFKNKRNLPKLPYELIHFGLTTGFLFHTRFFLVEFYPNYMKNVMEGCSNGMASKIVRECPIEVE